MMSFDTHLTRYLGRNLPPWARVEPGKTRKSSTGTGLPSSRHVSSLSFIHKTSRILVSSQPLLLGNGPDGAPFPTSQPTHPAAHGSTMIQRLYCMASCWRSVASLLRWCWLIALVITCKAPYIWRLHKWRDLHLQPYSFLWERVAWHEGSSVMSSPPCCAHWWRD